jgi:hypothetical protein
MRAAGRNRPSGSALRRRGIKQAVQMHDEIAHLGIVDGGLRLCLPDLLGRGVIRIDADEIDLRQVLELDAADRGQLAAKNQMRQLFGACGHRCELHVVLNR